MKMQAARIFSLSQVDQESPNKLTIAMNAPIQPQASEHPSSGSIFRS